MKFWSLLGAVAMLLAEGPAIVVAAQPRPLPLGASLPLGDSATAKLLYKGTSIPLLPITFELPSNTKSQIILVTGSFFTTKASLGRVSAFVDSNQIGDVAMFDSQAIHVAFPPGYFITAVGGGTHTLSFTALGSTQSDEDDSFQVLLFDYH